MPFDMENPPKVALNWTDAEKEKCISAANAALENGGDDQEAIFACIAAAGKSKDNSTATAVEQTATAVENEGKDMDMTRKTFDFNVEETKEVERDGKMFGTIKGYGSTFGNVDRGGDRIVAGAFKKTIKDHKKRNRPIRMLWQHDSDEIIGGFNKFKEDEKGLFVEGEINLDVQRGREAFALAKQGVITDMSIGFMIHDSELVKEGKKEVLELKEIELFEISLVGEPMNQQAVITDVKSIEGFTEMKDVSTLLKKLGLSNMQVNVLVSKIKEFTPSRKEKEEEVDKDDRNDQELIGKIDGAILCQKMDNLLNHFKEIKND